MQDSLTFRPFIFPTIFLILVGWGGIAGLLIYTEPLIWMRWTLFVLLFLALTGTSLPLVYFFHLRFPSDPPVSSPIIVRQAQWVGFYGLVLLWLRWGNMLSLWLAFGLAGGLLAIEWLIRLRERSRWNPPLPESDDESA